MKHVYYKCPPEKWCEGHCHFCDGGLSLCTVCGQAEGELEPECPGPKTGVSDAAQPPRND